jgi:methionine synthase / methylenetetrahydrofolate reductase(NADPH)
MTNTFLEALKEKPLLVDGAMGTLLYARGASTDAAFEQLNVSHPEIVQQVHIDYINAGSDVIETNSFSGNRLRLANFGLEDEVWKLNVQAAKVARNAREIAGQPVFIAGSVGPTGKLMPPFGDVSEELMSKAFQEQMEALLAGGVDLFVIETMSSLQEIAIAIKAARKVAQLPIVAQLSFSTEGHTLLGVTPEDAMDFLLDLGDERPPVVGINCGAGPGPVFDCLLRMIAQAKAHGLPKDSIYYSCMPNAGLPSLSGGRYSFQSRPAYCASYVEPYMQAGARLIGGCCGTTPLHISAMRQALDKYLNSSTARSASPAAKKESSSSAVKSASGALSIGAEDTVKEHLPAHGKAQPGEEIQDLPDLAKRLQLAKEKRDSSDFFVSVELDPPKGAVTKKILQAAQTLKEAGVDAINVGDSPMARVRMSSLVTCHLIGQNVGIDTIIHFTTRDRNLMGIQADLLGCQALGIRNVLALTGDPPSLGNYVHATAVYDVDSVGLIGIIGKLNEGVDIAGNSIGKSTRLSIACALNHTGESMKEEIERFRRKIQAGAHFAMTQPIYQLSDLTNFLEQFGECPIPILVGIMPLHSFKHAEYLHNEVPGISIPEKIRRTMEKAGDEGAKAGLALAQELLLEVRPYCQGTYLVPSFGRYDDMCVLVRQIKASAETPAIV